MLLPALSKLGSDNRKGREDFFHLRLLQAISRALTVRIGSKNLPPRQSCNRKNRTAEERLSGRFLQSRKNIKNRSSHSTVTVNGISSTCGAAVSFVTPDVYSIFIVPFTVPADVILHGIVTVHDSGCVLPSDAGSTVLFMT